MSFAYGLSIELYIPPYEFQDEITVNQMHFRGKTINFKRANVWDLK
jgi:hypothetical protein